MSRFLEKNLVNPWFLKKLTHHHVSLCLLPSASGSLCSENFVRSFIKCSCGLFRTHCCTASHRTFLHCSTMHCSVQHCTTLHCTAQQCTDMKIIALYCTWLNYPVLLIVLHCTAVMIFNRRGVAGAVLQSPASLIDSLIHSFSNPFPPNLQNIITPKP